MENTAQVYDFSAAHGRRSSRMENQKQGHFSLFRSLLSKEWAKDTAKLAMWIRLIGGFLQTSHSRVFRKRMGSYAWRTGDDSGDYGKEITRSGWS